MNLLSLLNAKFLGYVLSIAAVGAIVYMFHYKPLNELRHSKKICCVEVQSKIKIIDDLYLKINNLEEQLKKAKDDIETEKANVELCKFEYGAYSDINTTIKDTEDEGYLVF